jgi:hypothetical protein
LLSPNVTVGLSEGRPQREEALLEIVRRLARIRRLPGFSLVEALVGGLVLVVGLVAISQFFASAAGRVLDSDVRSVLHQVASEQLEQIRGLPYTEVGTTDGQPPGKIAPDTDAVIQNTKVHVHVDVVYWTDPSYTGPYPANYRRVTVSVAAVDRPALAPVELVTNVAGGASGGTLDVTVTDLAGQPVPGAQLDVTNSHLVPSVDIHSTALRTDVNGHMLIPGLVPDSTTSYVVTAGKSGYNTEFTDPGLVVVDGLPYTVVHLIIDQLSTVVITVVDADGNEVPGLNLDIVGPKDAAEAFEKTVTSAAGGVTLGDIRYSTDLYPYLVTLVDGQGYPTQTVKVVLPPGSTEPVVITVPAGGGPTTTVTVPTSSTSTSTTLKSSLKVTVYQNGNGNGVVKGAQVTLSNGFSATTNKDGWVFFDNLPPGTYGVNITANNFKTYSAAVDVSGDMTLDAYLDANTGGGGPGW